MSIQGSLSPLEAANDLYAAGKFAEAAEEYRKATIADSISASAWKGLGLSLIQSGQLKEAIEACQRAAQLQLGSADCRYAYGYALGADKQYDEAIKELDAALALQPNHGPAKHALIFALVQQGHSLEDTDPRLAETKFERAYKLDHKNPNVIAPVLEHLRKTGQKGKAVHLATSLDEDLRASQMITPILAKMEADPEFKPLLDQQKHVVAAQAVVQAPAPPVQQSTINYVPCPNCRQMIADYAAICPHCSFRNRATGTFAGRDTGPDVIWQEVALTIVSILWLAQAGWSIFVATQQEEKMMNFLLPFGIANAGVGLGLLFRVGWVSLIAKIFCWINLIFLVPMAFMDLVMGFWLHFAREFVQACLAGFLIYLINYNSDV